MAPARLSASALLRSAPLGSSGLSRLFLLPVRFPPHCLSPPLRRPRPAHPARSARPPARPPRPGPGTSRSLPANRFQPSLRARPFLPALKMAAPASDTDFRFRRSGPAHRAPVAVATSLYLPPPPRLGEKKKPEPELRMRGLHAGPKELAGEVLGGGLQARVCLNTHSGIDVNRNNQKELLSEPERLCSQ